MAILKYLIVYNPTACNVFLLPSLFGLITLLDGAIHGFGIFRMPAVYFAGASELLNDLP